MNLEPTQMMINMILQSNPQLRSAWQQTLQMTNGKSPEQIQGIVKNIINTQGIDINQAKQQFGQFMNQFQPHTPSGADRH